MVGTDRGMVAYLLTDIPELLRHVLKSFSQDWIEWLFTDYSHAVQACHDCCGSQCESHEWVLVFGSSDQEIFVKHQHFTSLLQSPQRLINNDWHRNSSHILPNELPGERAHADFLILRSQEWQCVSVVLEMVDNGLFKVWVDNINILFPLV